MSRVDPETIDQVVAVLRDANARKERVMPVGGGTHLSRVRPVNADIVLGTNLLDSVTQYHPDDMTISIEAGTTAGDLAAVLGEHRCRLPLDPEEPNLATIGGMVAVGYASPRRLGLGTLRDHLIGARFVAADGSIVKTGGMVVKNVSGYDMTKLLHGSMGSLGVIVELNFKLLPMPALELAVEFRLPNSAGALEAASILLASCLPYTALHARSDGALIVGCEGHPSDVQRLHAHARQTAQQFGGVEHETASGPDETERAWRRWIRATTDVAEFRIGLLPSALPRGIAEAESCCRASGFDASWRSDVGCGALDVSVELRGDDQSPARLERLLIDAFGSVRVIQCPERARTALAVFGREPRGIELMRALKSQFDPHGVLNAGVNVGGI